MKHKPTYQSGLSREQIEAYKTGSERVRREIEGAADSGFERDALEGWQNSPVGMEAMHRLDSRFSFTSKWPLYLGSAVLVGAVVTGILFFQPEHQQAAQPGQSVQLTVEQTDVTLPAAIDTLEALPQQEQIPIASVKTNQQALQEQPASVPVTNVEAIPDILLEPLAINKEESAPKVVKQKSAKEIYYHGLKLIDYSLYRTKPIIETERIVLTGTPADQENEYSEEANPTVTTVSIPYMDYIEKTMKYVNKGKWKESLQRLQLVLKAYPDDANGHFYAGLCSYNLQQYEDAKKHFSACLQLTFSNFNEEATWYLAKSYIANNEASQAKELLIVIRDQKGFYSKQADQLIRTIR